MGSVREKSSFDEVKGRYVVNIEGGETALTAQAPSWNYVCTPLRLRRRKQIFRRNQHRILAFANGVYQISLRDMSTTTSRALPLHTIPLAFSDMGNAFGDFVHVCDCAPKGAAWGTPSGFP